MFPTKRFIELIQLIAGPISLPALRKLLSSLEKFYLYAKDTYLQLKDTYLQPKDIYLQVKDRTFPGCFGL